MGKYRTMAAEHEQPTDWARLLFHGFCVVAAALNAALLPHVSGDTSVPTGMISVDWYVYGQVVVGFAYPFVLIFGVAIIAVLRQRPVAQPLFLKAQHGPRAMDANQERFPTTGLRRRAMLFRYLFVTAAGAGLGVLLGAPAGNAVFAWLGSPVLHGFGWLCGAAVGGILALPVVLIGAMLRIARDGLLPAESRRALVLVLGSIAVFALVLLPACILGVIAFDSPHGSRRVPDLGFLLFGYERPGVEVAFPDLILTARVLTWLMIGSLVSTIVGGLRWKRAISRSPDSERVADPMRGIL